jgi:hypothetical protein
VEKRTYPEIKRWVAAQYDAHKRKQPAPATE